MIDIWSTVHTEREALANDLADLAPDDWDTPSLCDGWTVHDVLAHLVHDASTTKPSFIVEMVRSRFDFNRANQRGLERHRRTTGAETLQEFRDVLNRTTSAPAPLPSRLVEVIVHSEDIRRPLGIAHSYPVDAVIEALKYQIGASDKFGGSKERVAGLNLIATDTDFTHGSGKSVSAPALELLMFATGRKEEPRS